jgi:tryptophan synthase alpha chain
MNTLDNLFARKEKDILSIYFTAGFPKPEDTLPILDELDKAGVDMVEIGMPFSDPLADGPVIQQSSEQALKNGMSLKKLFAQLRMRKTGNGTALVLMGYLNPVLQYGIENFCREAAACGIAGVILPDLPHEEYLDKYKVIFDQYRLRNIFLVTPQTSEARIRRIDADSNSFIYLVSSVSTTGSKNEMNNEKEEYFKRIVSMKLKSPLMIGFGISDKQSFQKACTYSHGAIIGSAFVKHLGNGGEVKEFIHKIKD